MKNRLVALSAVFIILSIVVTSGLALGKILVTNNPDYQSDAAFYKAVANELVKEGDYTGAILNYERSLGIAEDYNVRSNLAVLYYERQEYSNAIIHLRVLAESDPENPSYHYDLAVNLVDRFRNTDEKALDDLFLALREYELANGLEPGFQNSANNIAVLKKILQVG